jgi:DNA polymerase-3 subunit delta'
MENYNQIEELKKIADSKRVPNAIVLYGLNNEKLKAALNFSKIILSLNLDSEKKQLSEMMCNKLNHPDFHLIFPIPSSAKKDENICDFYTSDWKDFVLNSKLNVDLNGWKDLLNCGNKQLGIGVDSVTNLIKKLSLSSFNSQYKVVVFWEADRLNLEASNKILKTVEEPGNKTVFIFLCKRKTDLLPTIVSRCQTIGFNNMFIDQGSSEFEKLFGELLRSAFLIRKDLTQGAKIISWASKASKMDKERQKSFFRFSTELIRQSFLKNINATSLVNFEAKTGFNFDSFSKYVTKNNIEELCNQFENAHYQTIRNGNSNIIMTGLALGLTKSIHKQ